jgi:hypothetical protein
MGRYARQADRPARGQIQEKAEHAETQHVSAGEKSRLASSIIFSEKHV